MKRGLLYTLVIIVTLIALVGATYIAADLYRGLVEGSFSLVRGQPITSADGIRYKLAVLGESLAVLTLLGCSGAMLKLFFDLRKIKSNLLDLP